MKVLRRWWCFVLPSARVKPCSRMRGVLMVLPLALPSVKLHSCDDSLRVHFPAGLAPCLAGGSLAYLLGNDCPEFLKVLIRPLGDYRGRFTIWFIIWFIIWYRFGLFLKSICGFCQMDLAWHTIPFGAVVCALVVVALRYQARLNKLRQRAPHLVAAQIWEQVSPRLDAVIGPDMPVMDVAPVGHVLLRPEQDILIDDGRVYPNHLCYVRVKAVKAHVASFCFWSRRADM